MIFQKDGDPWESGPPNSWFYSDSVNDIPLMQIVSNPVAVDPDDKLYNAAKHSDWKIISLRE